ncbi:hypothetical protein CCHR01_03475 [Colletotrichum chrysophilum]|uniref:Uncharacterized protein n=1 Tax=Colletotrichum chrysophilum TaxID=1836956 RepID=A0AAD9ENL3_9PEZI|nr:hypothetical protein CCHR01_03475 [Colletotrichum chrysophilum]
MQELISWRTRPFSSLLRWRIVAQLPSQHLQR